MANTHHYTAARKRHKADRDMTTQKAAVQAIVKANEAQLLRFLPDTVEEDTACLEPGHCRFYDPAELAARKSEARSSSETLLITELKRTEALGHIRRIATPPASHRLDELGRDFPHFQEVLDLIRRQCALADVTPGREFALPPILLGGDPGVGKTAFCQRLAQMLSQPIQRVDIASSSAGFALGGSHSTWSSARHGEVWTLLQNASVSGVLLLDEIDKAADSKYPILGPLFGLLEPVSAVHFKDEYIGMPINASHLMVVGTCNDANLLDGALRSRFQEFNIPVPAKDQMPAVIRSVYRQMRRTRTWARGFQVELPEPVIDALRQCTPRQLFRVLEDAHARAAAAGRLVVQAEDLAVQRQGRSVKSRIGFI